MSIRINVLYALALSSITLRLSQHNPWSTFKPKAVNFNDTLHLTPALAMPSIKSQYDLVVLVIPLLFLTSSPNKSRVPTKPFLFNLRTSLMPSSSLSPATYTAAILPIINLGIHGDVLTTILFRMPILVNVKVCLLF